jgi:RNA polymerase sigma-70 factor, ECF subfamily
VLALSVKINGRPAADVVFEAAMADQPATDRLVAQRMASGDRQACAGLVRRHHAEVYGMLVRLCRDAHRAEDLTQETFAACWTSIAAFRGESSLATWLRRIAYHKFVDWRRQRKDALAAAVDIGAVPEPLSRACDDPVARLLADESLRQLHDAMGQVPAGSQEVLVLHYQEAMSFQEMSYLLDQPVGTVKWRVSQAIAELRQRLNSEQA